MSIVLATGLPGAGKSVWLANKAVDLLYRNKSWYVKSGILRPLASNLIFSPEVIEEFGPGAIRRWEDPVEIVTLRNCDVIWDEVATHMDATQWQNVPLELKRWLQQHRKFGVDVYGTTQDFSMIDISVRRLTSELYYLTKIVGSRDKSPTRPEVKWIWGVVMTRELDPKAYKPDDLGKQKKASFLPGFFSISRERVEIFDTTQEIKAGKYPPLRHIERECEDPNCTYHKVAHV